MRATSETVLKPLPLRKSLQKAAQESVWALQSNPGIIGTRRKPHPYDAICAAGDDHVSGIPLAALREGHARDVGQRPARGMAA